MIHPKAAVFMIIISKADIAFNLCCSSRDVCTKKDEIFIAI